jgi:hypothetical protein
MPDRPIQHLKKVCTLLVHTAGCGNGYTLHVHTAVGGQEYTLQASAFLPVISCFSLASAFRHQGSVRYRWLQISPALPRYGIKGAPF